MLLIFVVSNLCLFFFLGYTTLQAFGSGEVSDNEPSPAGLLILYIAAAVLTWIALFLNFQHAGPVLEQLRGRSALWLLASVLVTTGLGVYFFFRIKMAPWLISTVLSLILMVQFYVQYGPVGLHLSKDLADTLLATHIGISVVGQSFSLLACALSIILIRQQANLKQKRFRAFNKGPGLTKVDRLLMTSLRLGMLLYAGALYSGALIAQTLELGDRFSLGWKTLWALVVWLTYLLLVQGRNLGMLSAKRTAYLSFIGFGVLLATFFGTLFTWGSAAG